MTPTQMMSGPVDLSYQERAFIIKALAEYVDPDEETVEMMDSIKHKMDT